MNWENFTKETIISVDELVLGFFNTYPSCYQVGWIDNGKFLIYDGYSRDFPTRIKKLKPFGSKNENWTPNRILRLY